MSRLDDILEGKSGGFTPQRPTEGVPDEKRLVEALEADAPAPEPEPEEPVAQIAKSDIEALRAAGWSQDDIKGLSPDAAARHALREGRRQKTERAEEHSGPDDLEQMLTEEFSSKTAKKLAPIMKRLMENQTALQRGVREQVVSGVRSQLVDTYPELKRPEAMQAVLSVAGEDASPDAIERAARLVYGARQSRSERSEARAQVDGQMSAGRRGPNAAPDVDKAKRAAWAEYERTGNAEAALAVRRRLGG